MNKFNDDPDELRTWGMDMEEWAPALGETREMAPIITNPLPPVTIPEPMMDDHIEEVNENLLDYPLDGFIHQCNCFHTMGGGIALRIKQKYPEALKADLRHGRRGDITRLGKFSVVKAHDDKYIYNMYGQYNFGMEKRQTNYEAVYNGLMGIARHAITANVMRLGLPKNMGCRLGGGSWNVVRAIIEDIFDKDCGIKLYICNYEG